MTTLVTQPTIESSLFNSLANISANQVISNKTLKTAKERTTVTGTPATGTINFYVDTQSIMVYNTATANFNLAIQYSSTELLTNKLNISDSIGICLIVPIGATPYFLTGISIDGVVQTPKYQSGIAFSGGNTNATDMYNILIVKTNLSQESNFTRGKYEIFASQTKFA
jgi:hypothetical protein